jgi:hypothetical protein
MTRRLFFTFLSVALVGAGCGSSPTTPTTAPSPVTETFASIVYPQGAASQQFVAAKSGTVTITLGALAATGPVGLALGVTQQSGLGCFVSTVVQATAGTLAQITAPVDAGSYCVRVFDIGNLTGPAAFSVTIVRP